MGSGDWANLELCCGSVALDPACPPVAQRWAKPLNGLSGAHRRAPPALARPSKGVGRQRGVRHSVIVVTIQC